MTKDFSPCFGHPFLSQKGIGENMKKKTVEKLIQDNQPNMKPKFRTGVDVRDWRPSRTATSVIELPQNPLKTEEELWRLAAEWDDTHLEGGENPWIQKIYDKRIQEWIEFSEKNAIVS